MEISYSAFFLSSRDRMLTCVLSVWFVGHSSIMSTCNH